MTVGDICTRAVVMADRDETLVEAARRMRDHHVGDLVVIDSQTRPVGILTDRDIVVAAVAQSADRLDSLTVGDVMTRDPLTARDHEPVEVALDRMQSRGVRRLPVLSADGRLEGLVSLDDILENINDDLTSLIRLVAREQKRERQERPA
jgi:CBS domain-containing protein